MFSDTWINPNYFDLLDNIEIGEHFPQNTNFIAVLLGADFAHATCIIKRRYSYTGIENDLIN